MNNNMQDILKNYYASGGKTLFEADPLERERQRQLAYFKQQKAAGVQDPMIDANLKMLSKQGINKFNPEYIAQVINHPETSTQDLNGVNNSLYARLKTGVDNPELKDMIDTVNAELKKRGKEKIQKMVLVDIDAIGQDDYSYRNRGDVQHQKSGADIGSEQPLSIDMPDDTGIDIGALFQQGESPEEIINTLSTEYQIGRSRAQKMVDQWQASSMDRSMPPQKRLTRKLPSGNQTWGKSTSFNLNTKFNQLLKSFVDDGYSDADIIDLVNTDTKLNKNIKMAHVPGKLKKIRGLVK